jgi:hypothetical protein
VGGALLLPWLRTRLSAAGQLTAGSLVLGLTALVIGLVHVTAVVAVVLAFGGMAWVLALSTLNSAYQLTLPGWVKARGMSFYLIVFQGGNAIGAAVLGLVASLAGLRLPFQNIPPASLQPAGDWPAPQLAAADSTAPAGPVMVTVNYRLADGQRDQLLAALRDSRFSRDADRYAAVRALTDPAHPRSSPTGSPRPSPAGRPSRPPQPG